MEYYKINYNKLSNLYQRKYFIFMIIIIILIIILIIISSLKEINKSELLYGIYDSNILKFKINSKLSDTIKKNNIIIFNDQEVTYDFISFDDYEVINNELYQTVNLKIDGYFYPNEVGIIKLCYGKEKIIAYIFELFK